jgi:hypothetical protein
MNETRPKYNYKTVLRTVVGITIVMGVIISTKIFLWAMLGV